MRTIFLAGGEVLTLPNSCTVDCTRHVVDIRIFIGRRASPYSNTFGMNQLTAPRYASPISYLKMNCSRVNAYEVNLFSSGRTKNDSDSVTTASFVRYSSLFLSCGLKNHSLFSMRSLSITPFSPETRSYHG